MMNHVAVFFAIIFGVAGLIFISSWYGLTLLILSGLMLTVQIISRVKHILAIRSLLFQDGKWRVFDRNKGNWYAIHDIEKVRKDFFVFADPWRPITIGYPGREIKLMGIEKPVLHLCPYGCDELRDQIYDRVRGLVTKGRQKGGKIGNIQRSLW